MIKLTQWLCITFFIVNIFADEVSSPTLVESESEKSDSRRKFSAIYSKESVLVISLQKRPGGDRFYISSFGFNSTDGKTTLGYSNYSNDNIIIFATINDNVFQKVFVDLKTGECSLYEDD